MATRTREFVRDLDGFTGTAKLWRVSPAVEYGYGERKKTEYVVSSATVAYSGAETYLFPADVDGEILDWGELPGSQRGTLDHDAAMNDLADEWEDF